MWSQDKYQKALKFASKAHFNQRLTGTNLPYIIHPVNVAMEVMSAIPNLKYVNHDLAIECALLHDVIEDTKVTYSILVNEFGKEIAEGVSALSKNKDLPKKDQLKDSLERIVKQPFEIWMVKLADRISNLEPPPDSWQLEKRKEYLKDAKLIYETLKAADPTLKERLKKKINEYKKYLK